MSWLSKSDFKSCFDCRTKLYYRKNRYPSNRDDDPYLRFLADGGFMVEAIAKAGYPQGHDLAGERDHRQAAARTREILDASEDATIFEAAAIHRKYLARIDILHRQGGVLHLIEVKSKSIEDEHDQEAGAGDPFLAAGGRGIKTPWKPYLLDVAFQTMVLRLACQGFTVKPWLWLVNKQHRVSEAETLDKFKLTRAGLDPRARPEVVYSGPPGSLELSGLLRKVDVSAHADMLMPEVERRAGELADLLGADGGTKREKECLQEIYKVCRECEYRFTGPSAPPQHGFAECWEKLAAARPHVLDLYRVGQIGSTKFADPVPELIGSGKASLLDLREDQLGVEGKRRDRRLRQWKNSAGGGTECLPPGLRQELMCHQEVPGWPLHFVDFEACNVVLPHHAGLRPYERVAFQWSCHRVGRDGGLEHREWLNTTRVFPNFQFARTLREALGERGTIYVWSDYEQGTLKKIHEQLGEWREHAGADVPALPGCADEAELDALADWIAGLGPRIRDLHRLAEDHYFHPAMGGRTSIKVVLPAVWGASARLRGHPWFKEYLAQGADGRPVDPYDTLPALPFGNGEENEDRVAEGTGAIRVYQDLIFLDEADARIRANREQLLRQYCRLDTAAMVMIWKHWLDGAEDVGLNAAPRVKRARPRSRPRAGRTG